MSTTKSRHSDQPAMFNRRVILQAGALTALTSGIVASITHALSEPLAQPPPGFRSAMADLDGVTIHYVIGGSGPPILLVHGWPQYWFAWREVMQPLAQHYTVVAADYRGAGLSSITRTGYDKKTMAADLHRLMVRLGYPRATLVGHDWGAAIAYAYAAQYREAVESLILVEGRLDGPWSSRDLIPFLHHPPGFFVPNFAERILSDDGEAAYLDWIYHNEALHVVPLQGADIAEYKRALSRPGRMRAALELYRTLDLDIRDNAQFARTPLSIPVLAIGTQGGLGASVAETFDRVATRVVPVLMEQTGHFVADERPQVLAGLIEGFLAREPINSAWTPEFASL